ncbi:hypothetical protein GQ53DRAFT_214909 [Thozetella sp. PMI_491]|nr:hypothetical protein GQ53DRAFT_214909 [Thozetella sp. PMI_491]
MEGWGGLGTRDGGIYRQLALATARLGLDPRNPGIHNEVQILEAFPRAPVLRRVQPVPPYQIPGRVNGIRYGSLASPGGGSPGFWKLPFPHHPPLAADQTGSQARERIRATVSRQKKQLTSPSITDGQMPCKPVAKRRPLSPPGMQEAPDW